MQHISVWNPKGGQSKTMTSLNLAAAASKMGLRVLLFSTDVQDGDRMKDFGKGSYKFDIQGMYDEGSLHRKEYSYDFVIIDYPAGFDKPPVSDVVVVPIVPNQNDYDSFLARRGDSLLGKNVIYVAANCDMRYTEQKQMALAMRRKGAAVIKRKSVFNKAANAQRTIFDVAYNKETKIGESRAEVEAVLSRAMSYQHDEI